MKLTDQVTKILESENEDTLEGIADYLSNSLEHEENDEDAVHFLVVEYGLNKIKASRVIAAWLETPAKERLKMDLKEMIDFLKFTLE